MNNATTRSLRFVWLERKDGAETLYCEQFDGHSAEALSPAEIAEVEGLIASLAVAEEN